MFDRILIAGSGGQGIVLAGRVLATAAVRQVSHVTFFPSYGAEVRGGISNCQVMLSSDEIASPIAEQFDAMLLMNPESLSCFLRARAPGGLVVANSSLCQLQAGPGIVRVGATDMADELGDARAANLIMLGVLLRQKALVSSTCLEQTLEGIFLGKKDEIIKRNIQAFRMGLQYDER
jgi:2-oxoglutarate ferredoxin oxidoreductase subunit gamma